MRLLTALMLTGPWCLVAGNKPASASPVPGLDSAVTTQADVWSVRASERASLGDGQTTADGDYRSPEGTERERRYELSLSAAFRPARRLELSGSLRYLRDTWQSGESSSSRSGLGDLVLRIRFEPIDEAPRDGDGFPWPALALLGALRVPTAATSATKTLGLGAWELAEGLALERSATTKLHFSLTAEVGVRSTDTSLGTTRRPGPRISTQLAGWYWVERHVAFGLTSALIWEGDTRVDDEWQRDTGTLQPVAAAGVVYRHSPSGFSSGATLRHASQLPFVGANASKRTTIELSLAYAR